MKPWIRFESIEIKRNGYYVSYSPKFVSSIQDDSTAVLSVHFISEHSLEQCKKIAEFEFEHWVERYPVPLQVIVKFEYQTLQKMSSILDCPYICGVSVTDYRWGNFSDGEPAIHMPSSDKLNLIYSDLSSKRSDDVDKELRKKIIGIRIIKWFVLFTAVIIPALIAFLGWAHPVFSVLALIFAWIKCADKWLSLSGRKLYTEAELLSEKDKQLKEHHHYHCKENPKGFERLKSENFRASKRDQLHEKLETMDKGDIEN